jgi:hypothetical protein
MIGLATIFALASLPLVAITAHLLGKPNSMLIVTMMALTVLALGTVAYFVAGRHPRREPGTDKKLRS